MDARRLDDVIVVTLLAAANAASQAAASTPSGSWTDISNLEGDLAIVVSVGAVTGGFGTIAVQAQVSSANTGASATNCTDPRGTSLSIAASGSYILVVDSAKQPSQAGGSFGLSTFLGITTTYTTVTAANMSAVLVTRSSWNSGATDA